MNEEFKSYGESPAALNFLSEIMAKENKKARRKTICAIESWPSLRKARRFSEAPL